MLDQAPTQRNTLIAALITAAKELEQLACGLNCTHESAEKSDGSLSSRDRTIVAAKLFTQAEELNMKAIVLKHGGVMHLN